MRRVHSCVGVYADLRNHLYCIRFNLVQTKNGYQYEILKVTDSQGTITINDGVKTIVGLFQIDDKRLDTTAFNVLGNLNRAYASRVLSHRSPDMPLRFRFYDAVTELEQSVSMVSDVNAENRFKGLVDFSEYLSYIDKLTPPKIRAIAAGEDSPDGLLYALMNSVSLLESNLTKHRDKTA